MGEEKEEGRQREVIDGRARVEEAVGEEMQMLLGRNVVKQASPRKGLAPDHGDKAQKVMDHQNRDRDDTRDDLAGGERGSEATDGRERGAHQEKNRKTSEQRPLGERWRNFGKP